MKITTLLGRVNLLHFSGMFFVISLVSFVLVGIANNPHNGYVQLLSVVWFFSGVFCILLFLFHFIGKWLHR